MSDDCAHYMSVMWCHNIHCMPLASTHFQPTAAHMVSLLIYFHPKHTVRIKFTIAQLAGAVEYTDYFSAEE